MATATQAAAQIQGTALSRFVRVSPQKARLVIDLIRGHRAEDALQTLRFTKKRIAKDIEKILRSAIANAERKADDTGTSLDVDQLFVTSCFVNEGPRWKRMRPAPQGRGFRYQKRTAHITVQVAEHARAAVNRAAEAAAEEASSKGVKGAIRKARKTIEKRAKDAQKQQQKKKK
jgi:large subunit ribosomal protein L22